MAAVENSDLSHSFASKALDYLAQHKLPAEPKLFEVWYAYVSGTKAQVVAEIDKALESGNVSVELCNHLYNEYCSEDGQVTASVMTVGNALQTELDELVNRIGDAMVQTNAYGDTLQLASGQLDKEQSGNSIKLLVDNLVAATRQMETRSKDLETRLEQTAHQVKTLQSNLDEIRKEASTDQLTNLPNRKAFDEKLGFEADDVAKTGKPLSLLFTDIDHFKKFNDTWGHQTGDMVLKLVSFCLGDHIEGEQMAARFGGEEFAVILPDLGLDEAKVVAEKIREDVAHKKLKRKSTGEDLGKITISIGVAQFTPGENIADFVHRADACLYAAKRTGRNKVVGEKDPDVSAADDLKQRAS